MQIYEVNATSKTQKRNLIRVAFLCLVKPQNDNPHTEYQ